MATSLSLKEQGNLAFASGAWKEADALYTRAIQRDPVNPALFTNRARTRLNLERWSACLADSLSAIDLFGPADAPSPLQMKAYYYLAQAQLGLARPGEGLASALRAYDLALAVKSPSAASLSTLVLRAKKERWEALEVQRLRRQSAILRELEAALERVCQLDEANEAADAPWPPADGDAMDLDADASAPPSPQRVACAQRIRELRSVFARADPATMAPREVPEYLIDSITFAIMHDPVVTKNGHSYERSAIEAHLKTSATDPLTREPLRVQDLRPNIALREAAARFLEENGWAVDW